MADEAKTFTEEEFAAKLAEAEAGLKAKNAELLDEAKAAKRKNAELEGQVQEVQAKLQELEHARAGADAGMDEKKVQEITERIRADLERKYASLKDDLAAAQETIATVQGENRTLKLDNVVKTEMGKAGVRPERIDSLFRLTSDQYDLTEEGDPILKDSRETPLDKYIGEQLAEEYPEFFQGTGSSGGGASRSAGGAGGVKKVAAGDNAAFIDNLDAIADGSVEVAA